MTDTSRDARVTAWHIEITRKLDALRTRWAEAAKAEATRPPKARRQPKGSLRFRPAGPPDAAEQARLADEARQLAQVRAEWLIAMERTAMDIVMITGGP